MNFQDTGKVFSVFCSDFQKLKMKSALFCKFVQTNHAALHYNHLIVVYLHCIVVCFKGASMLNQLKGVWPVGSNWKTRLHTLLNSCFLSVFYCPARRQEPITENLHSQSDIPERTTSMKEAAPGWGRAPTARNRAGEGGEGAQHMRTARSMQTAPNTHTRTVTSCELWISPRTLWKRWAVSREAFSGSPSRWLAGLLGCAATSPWAGHQEHSRSPPRSHDASCNLPTLIYW